LKIADCHFFRKEYVEAIAAYEEFKKIHPSHEDISYVQFQIGMSYFNQMLNSDRDQTFTKKALSSFEYLIANYPATLFTEKARERIRTCRKGWPITNSISGISIIRRINSRQPPPGSRVIEKFPGRSEEDKTFSS